MLTKACRNFFIFMPKESYGCDDEAFNNVMKLRGENMLDYYCFQKIQHFFSQGKTSEALQVLMELQARYIALQDESKNLKERVQELEDIIFLSKTLYFDKQFYWIKIASITQGPFCPSCYERDGTLFRLHACKDTLCCAYCGVEYLSNAHAVGEYTPISKPVQAKIFSFANALKK